MWKREFFGGETGVYVYIRREKREVMYVLCIIFWVACQIANGCWNGARQTTGDQGTQESNFYPPIHAHKPSTLKATKLVVYLNKIRCWVSE